MPHITATVSDSALLLAFVLDEPALAANSTEPSPSLDVLVLLLLGAVEESIVCFEAAPAAEAAAAFRDSEAAGGVTHAECALACVRLPDGRRALAGVEARLDVGELVERTAGMKKALERFSALRERARLCRCR